MLLQLSPRFSCVFHCNCSPTSSNYIYHKEHIDKKELTMVGIDRKSSIETEPRTLDIGQMRYAREAAIYVISTTSIEEAMCIFTEGLEPVVKKSRDSSSMDSNEELINGAAYDDEVADDCNADDFLRRDLPLLRDVVSAPF